MSLPRDLIITLAAFLAAGVLLGAGFYARSHSTMSVLGRPVPVTADILSRFEDAARQGAIGRGGMYAGTENTVRELRQRHRAYRLQYLCFAASFAAALIGWAWTNRMRRRRQQRINQQDTRTLRG